MTNSKIENKEDYVLSLKSRGYEIEYQKISKIEKFISDENNLYDIEVEDDHTFVLSDGLIIHNSTKQGRDRKNQAVLPLKGKVLNIEKADAKQIYSNKEIVSIINAIGAGFGKEFDINKVRYHKIILLMDSDVDGGHISTLLMTLFYRYMKPIIEAGYLYIADTPLYRLKKGSNSWYLKDARALENFLKEKGYSTIGEASKKGYTLTRFKGLGEMNPDQLKETALDPATRTLKQIQIGDAAEADKLFETLMGDAVAPRRKFIEENALTVKNVDI